MNVPLPKLPYSRTYRFGEEHISILNKISKLTGKDQAELVREGISLIFAKYKPDTIFTSDSVTEQPELGTAWK